jgi:hypothetical protein
MQTDPNQAIEYLIKNAAKFAQAKANRVYIENFLRSKKSLLMAEQEGSIAAKEAYAYAHPEYRELLEGLRSAVEAEETLKWILTAADLRVQVWRTEEASNRRQDRSTQ